MSNLASNSTSVANQSAFYLNTKNTWLLPDGVVDLLSTEAVKQETLRYQLTRILISHGYEFISPPMIEYTESLLGYASEDVKLQTFKIIDQLTGRLMGVRADITPQIARIDARLHNNQDTSNPSKSISRYCYAGHVIYTMPKGLFGSRTPLQLGAEIFGTDSLASEVELLDVLFTLLDSTDVIARSHIDIGHVAIFQQLCQLANVPTHLQEKLIELYANKALPELKLLTSKMSQFGELANDFYVLGEAGNDLQKLSERLSTQAKHDAIIAKALSDLTYLVSHLEDHWDANVSVDVTGLGYHYHTGVVFNVYVADESLPLIRGGRFSNHFHHEVDNTDAVRSGVGFSCELNRWQNHIQVHEQPFTVVPYSHVQTILHVPNHPDAPALKQAIDSLRQEGHRVMIALDETDEPEQTTHRLQVANGVWYLEHLAEN